MCGGGGIPVVSDIMNFASEIPKAITRPLDKLIGTDITKEVDRTIMPILGAGTGFALGGPAGAALGAGATRAERGFEAGNDPSRVLKNALFSAGLGYAGGSGAERLLATPEVAGAGPATNLGGGVPTTTGQTNLVPALGAGPVTPPTPAFAPGSEAAGFEAFAAAPPAATPSPITPQNAMAPLISTGGSPGVPPPPTQTPPPTPQAGGMDWKTPAAVLLASNALGSGAQSEMMGDLGTAQRQSYDEYLDIINPPEAVRDVQFQKAKSGITEGAAGARRRLGSTLASRGIRGQGATSPTATTERSIQDALNRAYWDTYGTYNVPSGAPPVDYAPSAGQLFQTNAATAANQFIPWYLLANAR